MDSRGRWLVKHCMTSHPMGDGVNSILQRVYLHLVGDETDTSPFPDTSDQEYISTKAYIQNMNILMNYISSLERKFECKPIKIMKNMKPKIK